MIDVEIKPHNRISQGDIYKNIEWVKSLTENKGIINIDKIVFPRVIILSQDCDLDWDSKSRNGNSELKNTDKHLLSVLAAPIYNADHVFQGEHLSKLGQTMNRIEDQGRTHKTILVNNKNPRYHYLEFPPDIPIPDSIIDFKHYFSLNVEYLLEVRKINFVCKISELFREDISQRFASFLSRIGLPEIKQLPTSANLPETKRKSKKKVKKAKKKAKKKKAKKKKKVKTKKRAKKNN